jgi:hypothetical protein
MEEEVKRDKVIYIIKRNVHVFTSFVFALLYFKVAFNLLENNINYILGLYLIV